MVWTYPNVFTEYKFYCGNVLVLWLVNKCRIDMHNKHETYRTSAPRVGAYTIPCDDIEAGRTEIGTVGRTNKSTSAGQFRTRDWIPVVHASRCPCVHVSPVRGDHGSPSKRERSRSKATSFSTSQGDVAIIVDLQQCKENITISLCDPALYYIYRVTSKHTIFHSILQGCMH